MAQQPNSEERIQSLANILSLVAIVGGMDKAAVQRVLISLGSNLINSPGGMMIEPDLAARLLAEIAREDGEESAMRVAADMAFVARAWKPVLDEYFVTDPHQVLPYAEILFALLNYTGHTLIEYDAFTQFGGPDLVLAMPQMTAALKSYPFPRTGLVWELVGFEDPPDYAIVASAVNTMYLFKLATSNIDVRFSELDRQEETGSKQEHDVRLDSALFGACVAGLLGDTLYWASRLRGRTEKGQQTWRRLQSLLTMGGKPIPKQKPDSGS